MLLEFGFKNFFSFKEGVSISFELDNNCPPAISHEKKFTTILAVKGANASGKTQVLKGLSFLGYFCTKSFQEKPDGSIGIMPFFNSKKPSEFYAKFMIGDTTYLYELSLTEEEVKKEVIYRTKGRKTKILERKNNTLNFLINELNPLNIITLRKNVSIISTAHQYQLKELDDIYTFFNNIVSNVTFGGLSDKRPDIKQLSALLHDNEPALNFVKEFIGECDVGVSDIKIIQNKLEDGSEEYFPVFLHDVAGSEQLVTRHTESSGTKMLFMLLPLYQVILHSGGILVLDEFDMHLHPHILPKLLNFFEAPKTNKKDAQLLFTTHNSEILNYLGKYRTYLTNKENNSCFAYRLDEIPGDILRNDRPILPMYNDGKIGGVPKI